MAHRQVSFVVDVYDDDIVIAKVSSTPEWNRDFAGATEAERQDIVMKLRADAHHRLDDVFHLLIIVGDPGAVEKMPTR
jgi:hypothetical protein